MPLLNSVYQAVGALSAIWRNPNRNPFFRSPPVFISQSICIPGGGFGGLYTALALSKLNWENEQPDIVLVDQCDQPAKFLTENKILVALEY